MEISRLPAPANGNYDLSGGFSSENFSAAEIDLNQQDIFRCYELLNTFTPDDGLPYDVLNLIRHSRQEYEDVNDDLAVQYLVEAQRVFEEDGWSFQDSGKPSKSIADINTLLDGAMSLIEGSPVDQELYKLFSEEDRKQRWLNQLATRSEGVTTVTQVPEPSDFLARARDYGFAAAALVACAPVTISVAAAIASPYHADTCTLIAMASAASATGLEACRGPQSVVRALWNHMFG